MSVWVTVLVAVLLALLQWWSQRPHKPIFPLFPPAPTHEIPTGEKPEKVTKEP